MVSGHGRRSSHRRDHQAAGWDARDDAPRLSARINPDGAITGLPYLWGAAATADGGRILAYFQGMLARPKTPRGWVTMSGVFRIPPGAARVTFQLGQAEQRDVPQNGSVAWFDDLGFFLFPTEAAARAFVASWSGRR